MSFDKENDEIFAKVCESQSLSNRAMSFDVKDMLDVCTMQSQSLSNRAMSFDVKDMLDVCTMQSQSLSSRAMSFDSSSST